MRVIKTIALLSLTFGAPALAQGPDVAQIRSEASSLYAAGMFEGARTLFEKAGDDPVSQAYVVLCALRAQSPDRQQLLDDFFARNVPTVLNDEICYRHALNLFDAMDYSGAAAWFSRVNPKNIDSAERAPLAFKKGYCAFNAGDYSTARRNFKDVEEMEMSEFKAPSRYTLGYMDYVDRNFPEAVRWFDLSVTDPRFEDLSRFYLVDCHFMLKDYDYVIAGGEAIYDSSPKPRQTHLARLISESYLVSGDNEKAREFYSRSSTSNMTRSDYFYAGSVLYAVDDYTGAIENFEKMTARTDSLGQIANYQLGNAYVRTRNKVAALDAFKAASAVSFNPEMQEDAWFNYAKLAFDINKDTSGFTSYIRKYNTSRKGDQIYGYMALAMLYDHDYAGAVDAYDHIDELDSDMQSNYIKAYYLRAEQLVSNGAYTDAIPYLKAAAYYLPKQNRLNQISRYWQAECNYRTDKFEQAADIFADLYNLSALPGQTEGELLPYNVAYSHFNSGAYDNAARWFDIYLSEGSKLNRSDAMVRRADCDFARKMYKEAAESYGRAIDDSDISKDLYPVYQQGLALGLAGDKKGKVASLSAAGRVSPDANLYGETLYELGRAYMDIKDNDMAVDVFTRLNAETADKTFKAKSLIGLGMAYRNKKDYDTALDSYKKVVKLAPGTEYADDALLAIESIYQTIKQPQKYLEYVEQNRLDADKSEAAKEEMYFNTAAQLYMSGDWVQAVSSCQKYLESYPEGSHKYDVFFYIAESYKGMGNKEKACEYYKMVSEAGSSSSFLESSVRNSADLSCSLERYPEAYQEYSRLLSVARFDENKTAARIGMMRAAFRGKDFENAISAATQVRVISGADESLRRETDYIEAKSCLATSRREEALELFRALAKQPSTAEGAEARYILVQDAYNRGDFDSVQKQVFEFSDKAGEQSYYLARSYITLADAFVEVGKLDQARATYESVRDGYTATRPDDDIQNIIASKLSRLETL